MTAGTSRRVLVTGSRGWRWPGTISEALDEQHAVLPPAATMTVVVGYDPQRRRPRGTDRHAYEWAHHHELFPRPQRAQVVVETHPADWGMCGVGCMIGDQAHRRAAARAEQQGREPWCPRAGHRRNQQMVDSRPDVVLAFCLDDSPGTIDCIERARRARLPVLARFFYS